jgi:hypothetical protein
MNPKDCWQDSLHRWSALSQHGKVKRGHTWDSGTPSQFSSGRRHYIPWTAQPLWAGLLEKDLRFYSCYQKTEITAVGDPPLWLRDTPLSTKGGTNVADKGRSLGRYSSLADSGHGVVSDQNWGLQNQRKLWACFHTNPFRVANRYLGLWSFCSLLFFLGHKISLWHHNVVCGSLSVW